MVKNGSGIRNEKTAIAAAGLTFLFGLFMIRQYPVVYWDDAYTRLAYRDQLLVGRWLPASQILVYLTGDLPFGLTTLRVLLAAVAAGTVLAGYHFTADLFGRPAGLLAAALAATHTLFLALSIVPYPEVPFVGLCFSALYFLRRAARPRDWWIAYVCILLLTLLRYEAWLFVPVFVLLEARRGFEAQAWRGALQTGFVAGLVLGAVPVLWYFFGTYRLLEHEGNAAERIASGEVAAFFASLLSHPWWRTRLDILLFGAAGSISALLSSPARLRTLAPLLLAAIQFGLLALAGIWEPQNLRLTFFLTMMLVPYAGHGLILAAGWLVAQARRAFPSLQPSRLPEYVLQATAAAGFAALAYAGAVFVAGANATPVYQAGHAAAAAFGEREFIGVLVLTDAPVGPYVFASYSDVPLDAIHEVGPTTLDHRLPAATAESLAAAGISHVVAAFADAAGLSPEELALVDQLNSGAVANVRLTIGEPAIWELEP